MNTVEFVKSLLKEKRVPLSRIEKDLGFANGYIGQLKKGTFPSDRLFKRLMRTVEFQYIRRLLPHQRPELAAGSAGEAERPLIRSRASSRASSDA